MLILLIILLLALSSAGAGYSRTLGDMECGGNDAALSVRDTTKVTKFPEKRGNHEGHEVHKDFWRGIRAMGDVVSHMNS